MLLPIPMNTGSSMKTTIDIPDPVLDEVRKLAEREGTTVKALVERGLRRVLADDRKRSAFTLRKASFKGKGLRPELENASWDRLRELAYEGRGG
jgi:predicted DNA-binding ribbon-helix-helix protein